MSKVDCLWEDLFVYSLEIMCRCNVLSEVQCHLFFNRPSGVESILNLMGEDGRGISGLLVKYQQTVGDPGSIISQ